MFKKISIGFIYLSLVLVLIACNQNKEKIATNEKISEVTTPEVTTPNTTEVATVAPIAPTAEAVVSEDSAVVRLNRAILLLLKNQDYLALSQYIHPDQSVRFSPYGYIDTLRNQQFSLQRFKSEINSSKKFTWGSYDGSGDPILLTLKAYLAKFVYNQDFLHAKKTSLNKMLGSGNSLNNLEAVYAGLPYVESYFPGFDKKYAGMDWCSLRLVFKKFGDTYFLVAVVHDQWTT